MRWCRIWLGVRQVGVLPCLKRFGYSKRMKLGVLDLRGHFGLGLSPDMREIEEGSGGQKGVGRLPGHLVGLDSVVGPLEGVQTELLDVCLAGGVIGDGIICRILGLGLLELVHHGSGIFHALSIGGM